jgi:hypothetical protein
VGCTLIDGGNPSKAGVKPDKTDKVFTSKGDHTREDQQCVLIKG